MAKIYAKPVSGGFDNTLILDSREALVIPFDFSGEYTAIKLQMMVSLTSGNNDNSAMENGGGATQNVNINNNHRNRWIFGFTTKDFFPGESGCVFAGLTTASGETVSPLQLGIAGSPIYFGRLNTNQPNLALSIIDPTGGITSNAGTKIQINLSNSNFHSGSGNYLTSFGVELNFQDLGKSTARYVGYAYVKNNIGSLTGYYDLVSEAFSSSATYTSSYIVNYAHSGVALELPKYGFIYNPFIDYKLRIHGVGIIKVN